MIEGIDEHVNVYVLDDELVGGGDLMLEFFHPTLKSRLGIYFDAKPPFKGGWFCASIPSRDCDGSGPLLHGRIVRSMIDVPALVRRFFEDR